MSRNDRDRLQDVLIACSAIENHLARAAADEDLVFDAIRIRLVEIGEAVKGLSAENLVNEAGVPWSDITRMRDFLTHRYFDTAHSIVFATARNDIPMLAAAAERLLARFE
ncbi:HepT-like ribonuclease domain-containing protein [Leucobacter massiliensis]|uniref:Toxin-antitoxin system antitoxin subunit n=1 Tax=Leucobacter massiliensis TaxID=1686285 RepID=A0A2S9QSV3_9MICO|nr:HepT-like ribonuclease domain-containing protein [Leucobacter massiliensis]PRI12649.1 hypothetical protein B4915_00190 [Leucobacter massiliensis]